MEPVTQQSEELTIRFFGDGVEDIDAAVLATALQGLQRALHLTALLTEGRDVASRGQFPSDIVDRYALRCRPAVVGSFAMPMALPDDKDLYSPELLPKALDNLTAFIEAVSTNALSLPDALKNNSVFRTRFLKAVESLVPRPGSSYRVGLQRGTHREIVISESANRYIRELSHIESGEPSKLTVTGELEKIDFKKRVVTLIYPVTSKRLDCTYSPEIEDSLLDARHGYIQVSGTVILDDDGEPKEIVDVFDIRDLDDSDIVVLNVPHEDAVLRFRSPLRLQPQLTESKQLMYIEHGDLGIDVYGVTRESLLDELYEQISLIWAELVDIAPEETISDAASRLAQKWRNLIEEGPIGDA